MRTSRSRRSVVIFVVCLALPVHAHFTAPQDTPLQPNASLLEFPPEDMPARELHTAVARVEEMERRAEHDPDAATVSALLHHRRFDDALRALRRIVDTRPDRIADTLEALSDALPVTELSWRGYEPAYRAILAAAEQRVPEMSLEDAARTVFRIHLYRPQPGTAADEQAGRVERFLQEYAGTEIATQFAVNQRPYAERFDAWAAVAREHTGTAMAAMALHTMAWYLAHNNAQNTPYRGEDPTERFLHMMALVGELERSYPDSRWAREAPKLVMEFYAFEPEYGPGNIERMLDGYRRYVRAHFLLDETHPTDNGMGWVVAGKMAKLVELQGSGLKGIERLFSSFEQEIADRPALRYLRAQFYLDRISESDPSMHPELIRRASRTLESLAAEGRGAYHRRAQASLGMLYFSQYDYARARRVLEKYTRAYPDSPWTWAAQLRIGQCYEAQGEHAAAARLFQRTASAYRAVVPAAVLGHAFAARNLEASSDLNGALNEYRAAVALWDDRVGQEYSLEIPPLTSVAIPSRRVPPAAINKASLVERVARLDLAVQTSAGSVLERGRWLLEAGQWKAAAAQLDRAQALAPSSAVAVEARSLGGRARLEQALELAHIENPKRNETEARDVLTRLVSGDDGFARTAARIASATILWKQGSEQAARTLMDQALGGWLADQPRPQPRSTLTPLERDVAEIRDLLFRPRGDGIYAGTGWNAFEWPSRSPGFWITTPEVSVTLRDRSPMTVTLYQEFGDERPVLMFDAVQRSLLRRMVDALGGTKTKEPDQIMATPHQPIGASLDVMALWNEFFSASPWHWGGWVIETYPHVNQIVFDDDQRTRAAVKVTVGYSGGTILVEKENGIWKARRFVEQWVT